MNSIGRNILNVFRNPSIVNNPLSSTVQQQLQQWRGIKVKVRNGNLEQALVVMQRKMTSSGIERLIKRQQTHHLKNSEKRVLARKNLERRIRSQDLARKLKSILIKKVRINMSMFPQNLARNLHKPNLCAKKFETFSSNIISGGELL
ncbi:Ribosomal protein S21 [Macleaya cordata]|uniref:Ribosomal protein S21 n=1 Tax=Macleaya cordata TaxID=56857 RepID=A0A200RDN9_MACCD|nr:Ribosomal protein S21 [Macleaya cordata]